VRHCQTPARRLRVAGKRTDLARWTWLRRPRPAVDGGEAACHPAVITLGGIPNKVQVGDMTMQEILDEQIAKQLV